MELVDLFSKSKKRFQETKQYQSEKPKDEVSPSTKILHFFFFGREFCSPVFAKSIFEQVGLFFLATLPF